jgi:diaminopimelate decarboxylase
MKTEAASRGTDLAKAQFEIDGGTLAVGGISIECLARHFGTPLYVYDAQMLRSRLALLRDNIPPNVEVYYSVKANPNPYIIARFVAEGAGTEVASGGEYLRARAAGCPTQRIVFAGPGKTAAELELVLRGGIGEIHVESDDEILLLDKLAGSIDVQVDVSVRLNPEQTAAGGAMQMGGRPGAFGIDEERLESAVMSIERSKRLRLRGLHMFAGTQILDSRIIVGQWRHALELGKRMTELLGRPVETIDFGGGLGIPYFPNEIALDLDGVRSESASLFAEMVSDSVFAVTKFIVEPGRFLVGPAGVFIARVTSVKRSRDLEFIVLDGGMNHSLAASGNLGQVIKRDYPILNGTRLTDELRAETSTVVGPLCTPLDTIGRKVSLPETKVGDLLVVLQSGAYGLSASPVGFLTHPTPAELLVDRGKVSEIRRRGTFKEPVSQLPVDLEPPKCPRWLPKS